LFSTNSLGNDLAKCSSNMIYKLGSYSCCAIMRHSDVAPKTTSVQEVQINFLIMFQIFL